MTDIDTVAVAAMHSAEAETADAPPDVPEAFAVTDVSSANWLVRKVVEARGYAEHVKQWAAMELRRAERDEQLLLQRYGQQLERWTRTQIEGERRKSIKLPAGTVGFRNAPQKLDVIDERRLISWCRKSLPGALRVETHVLRSAVNEHVARTGEVPEGAEISSGQQRFYVR